MHPNISKEPSSGAIRAYEQGLSRRHVNRVCHAKREKDWYDEGLMSTALCRFVRLR